MKLLSKLPINEYSFATNDEYFLFRDIFVKLRIVENLRDSNVFLTTVTLNSYERADVVAHKMYGRSELFWTLYLVNEIMDPSEWLMDNQTLDKYNKVKYDNLDAVHHYAKNGVISDLRANQYMVNKRPFGTTDSNPAFDFIDPNTYFPVSFSENEEAINDSKRIIRAIRPEYMDAFLIDVEKKLRAYNG